MTGKTDLARKIKESIKEKYEIKTPNGGEEDLFEIIDNSIDDLEEGKEEAQLRLEIVKDIKKMRRRWSNWLLGCVILIVVCNYLFIFLLGFKIISIDAGIVPYFIGDSIVKIAGLSYIVVKFLFNPESTK